MKAAAQFERGAMPRYIENFPEPLPRSDDEIGMSVKAAALKHFDRSRASGKHYSAAGNISEARVIGGDGVGVLEDGTRIYAIGVGGMIAERAVIEKDRMVPLPTGIDDATAAALPNAVIGSAMPLRFKAGMQGGETVLINGATGFTGKMAVQLAKYYGAKKIIATGRNRQSLEALLDLGADEILSTQTSDKDFVAQLRKIHHHTPFDIILDYLWGPTAELIFSALKGRGSFTPKTCLVSIGSVTGDKIQLSAEILRSVNLQLSGSGLGSWTREEVQKLFTEILPEMFELAAAGKLIIETVKVNLKDIEKLWEEEVPAGKRLVIVI
ncbi:MAG: zinc-binding alcohol dehydrogenase family protein [Williamsia sp.]|nr:zinc-binding alcohol dehydrogenase family protein [Williamsia sp.]